uniref:Uncharacterized protein n=1 Tax=Anguilla anguilla TaxID=7936 RepID=A0A0E9P675_ANGAN
MTSTTDKTATPLHNSIFSTVWDCLTICFLFQNFHCS